MDMLANTQNSVIINKGKDLKISKNKFNRHGGQGGSLTSEKKYRPSGYWDNLISDILDMGFHLTNILEVRNFRKNRI